MLEGIRDAGLSTQDADLLSRLNAYFDDLEHRLRLGQGWLIFNGGSARGARLTRLILSRLELYRPYFSFYHIPWRDFALHSYVSSVALPQNAPLVEAEADTSPRRQQYQIASQVAGATNYQLAHADVVILSNIHPARRYEALALSETAVERTTRRRATIALTPDSPWDLARAFTAADPTATTWQRFFDAMHAASLIAI